MLTCGLARGSWWRWVRRGGGSASPASVTGRRGTCSDTPSHPALPEHAQVSQWFRVKAIIYSSSVNLFTTAAVSWQPGPGCSVLAAGYEKHRNDNALMVWDLGQGRVSDKVGTNHSPVFSREQPITDQYSDLLTNCSPWWSSASRTAAAASPGSARAPPWPRA